MNLIGQTIGQLKVLSLSKNEKNRLKTYLCLCSCGNEKKVTGKAIISSIKKPCTCLRKKAKNNGDRNGAYKHGLYNTRMHVIWTGMKQRCHNPKLEKRKWDLYGGRGIKVCDRWHDFRNFYEDMKDTYRDGLTLDRIDTNGNYEPSNCRWATRTEQANNISSNVFIKYKGQTLSISQWAVKTGLGWNTISERYKKGLKPREIFKPIKPPLCYSYDKNCDKYRVHVKGKDLGRFKTKKEAIEARDNYIRSKSYELLQTIK